MKEQFNYEKYQKRLERQEFITRVNQVLSGELDETSILTKDPKEIEQWLAEDLGERAKELTVENLRGVQHDEEGNVANSDFEVIIKKKSE